MENIFFPAVHECFRPPMYVMFVVLIIKLRKFLYVHGKLGKKCTECVRYAKTSTEYRIHYIRTIAQMDKRNLVL